MMFTRAGFNGRHRVICKALVAVPGGRGWQWADLIKFTPSGEMAWHSKRGNFLVYNREVWGNYVKLPHVPFYEQPYSNIPYALR